MYLDSDRKPPITPQLAIRVAIVGGAALVMFGIIFFRLWYLQVLSGDRYLAERPEQVGADRVVRVLAQEHTLDLDSGEARLVLLQVEDGVERDIRLQRDRAEGQLLGVVRDFLPQRAGTRP